MSDNSNGALPAARATAAEPVVSALRDGIAIAKVLVFADDPDRLPRLYACPKCGGVHSPEIYLATEERKHAAARKAAENCYSCRVHDECTYCGCETPKGWTACGACRLGKKLEKAAEIPDNGGPYCEFGGDQYFFDMDSVVDAGLEWVAPCTVTYPEIDADSILDGVLSDMFEDASSDDLVGLTEFYAAVELFNKAQTTPTYWADNTRKIRVPAQGIAAPAGVETSPPTEGQSPSRQGAPESPRHD